jgi:MFS family permease
MAATPLAMTAQYSHHTTDAMFVVQWHMVGMFAPSFVTGSLIHRFGLMNVLLCGLALTTGAAATGMFGGTLFHFWLANILVGAGWNFLFVGGTDLLTHCYRPSERAKAQGVNDFLVFGTVAAFSTAAGWVQDTAGWLIVCIVMVPFVAVVGVAVLWLKLTPGAAPEGVADARPAIPAAAE